MAEVHLALQRGPGGFEKLVVVKVIHEKLASDKVIAASLLEEAKHVALIKHPNVVDVYELGNQAGRYFLAMEYLEGEPLLAVLEAGVVGPRLDPLAMARIVADTAEGLDAAHKLKTRDGAALELIHDDISLGNIVVLYSGQVKLVDFGVAKAKHTAETTDKIYGKPAYMAPEKLDGKPADKRTDIWSLGVVLWEALAQKRLFRGDDPTQTIREVRYVKITAPSGANPSVPAELDAIALKALDRDPTKRFQTAKELANALEEVLRQKGYASKNDRIGEYMQKTFAEHIAARNLLVSEVTRRSRPSDAMLEAAFGPSKIGPVPVIEAELEPEPAETEELENPFSATLKKLSAELESPTYTPTPPGSPAAAANPFEDAPDAGSTVADFVPADPAASRTRPDPTWAATPQGSSIGQLQSWVQKERESRDRKPPVALYLVGSVVVMAIIVGIVMATRGDDERTLGGSGAEGRRGSIDDDRTRQVAAPPPPDVADAVAAVVIDAAPPPIDTPETVALAPVDAEPPPIDAEEAGAEPDAAEEIVFDSPDAAVETGSGSAAAKPVPKRPQKSAEAYYNLAMDWMRKGESRKALAALTESRRANERYAPTWYGLGLVHEKLGNKSSAKTAYKQYLKLAPRAANAQMVRERLSRL